MKQRDDAQLPVELVEEDLGRALETHEAILAGMKRILALARTAEFVPLGPRSAGLKRASSVA